MQKQIFIVRHGETDFNRLNIVQGSGVDMDINSVGMEQARLFFNYYQDHPFEKIYISALRRTQQSVQAFIDKGIPYEVLPELNEISWGDFEGKPQSNEQRAVYWETVRQWNEGNLSLSISNGESPLDLQERQKRILPKILESPEERILICMHGRAMKSFLCLLLNQPLTQMESFLHSNLCLYQLEVDGSAIRLIKSNDTAHLSTKTV